MSARIWKPSENYYPALRKSVADQGLYRPNFWRSVIEVTAGIMAFFACIALAALSGNWFVTVILAVLAGFAALQLGYVMHDAGHRQCSQKKAVNDRIGFLATAIIGIPFYIWIEAHNSHHNNPNHEEEDPDISLPLIAFDEHQVHEAKRSAYRTLIAHQLWFYLPLLTIIPFSKRYVGLMELIMERKKTKEVVADIFFNAIWHVWYPLLLVLLLGPLPALVFFLVQQGALGFFFGMVFAPNHKGMPMIEKNMELDFMTRQVVTSRNFRSNAFIDFLFGGLNYQIEHHLYPNMPRHNLPKAKVITEQYCKQHGIPYHETSLFGSYYEIYLALRNVSLHAKALQQPKQDLREQVLAAIEELREDLQVTEPRDEVIRESGRLIDKRLNEIESDLMQSPDAHLETIGEWRHELHEISAEVMDWIHDEVSDFMESAQRELTQMVAMLPPQKVAAVRFAHEQNIKKLQSMQQSMRRRRIRKRAKLEKRRQEVRKTLESARRKLKLLASA